MAVEGLSGATAITADGGHTCALLSNGTSKCWDENFYGQLGNGKNNRSGTSVTLTAAAATGSRFTRWSGACAGTATTCTVSMTLARSVTATFLREFQPSEQTVMALTG